MARHRNIHAVSSKWDTRANLSITETKTPCCGVKKMNEEIKTITKKVRHLEERIEEIERMLEEGELITEDDKIVRSRSGWRRKGKIF